MRLVIFLPALCAAAAVTGYLLSKTVPEELHIGKRWFLISSGIAAAASLTFLPWWQAALLTGLSIVGWLPGLLAAGWLSTTGALITGQIAIFLAFTTGSRWRAESFQPGPLYIGAGVVTILGFLLL